MIGRVFLILGVLSAVAGVSFAAGAVVAAAVAAGDPVAANTTAPADSVAAAADSTVAADSVAVAVDSSVAAPRPVLTLPEVRVSGDRQLIEARRRMPTAFVTELHAGQSNRALESMSELLGEAAGVRVVQYGGLGAFSTVSLRGAPAGQVSVYIDGAPLTSAAHSVVNLADLPVTAVERVEVYRGMAPLDWGLATPGGAINLVTRSVASPPSARVARGSFETWEGRGTWSGARGPVSALVHAGYQGSDGDFSYFDDNGTPLNPNDDATSIRQNNRFDASTLLGTLRGDLGAGGRLTLREDWFQKRQGVPGIGAVPALHPSLATDRSLSSLDWERASGRISPQLAAGASWERSRSRFRDTGAELGLGTHDTDDRTTSDRYTLSAGTPRLPFGVAAHGSGSWRGERFTPTDAADGLADAPPSTREAWGASLTLQARPLDDRVLLYAGRRWDRVHDALRSMATGGIARATDVVRELNAPQLGVRVTPLAGLELRGNWSRATRVPEFVELFGNTGSVMGSPTLSPEQAENWDAGAAGSIGHGPFQASVEWAHYQTHARDLIVYQRASPNAARATNISRADIEGDELTARIAMPFGLTASGAATWQSTIDLGAVAAWHGRRLPQRPERMFSARLDATRGPVRVTGNVEYIGENYLDRSNRQRVPERTLVGAALSFAAHGARLTVEGKNLGDARASDVGGFPLPGRSVFVSLELRLGPPAEQP